MRFLADECVSRAVVRRLRQAGHDVTWSAEIAPGELDRQALARSVADDRILLTRDQDFGDLIFRHGQPAVGVIRIRIDLGFGDHEIAEEALRRIEGLGEATLRGRFSVLETDRTRQRDLPAAADHG